MTQIIHMTTRELNYVSDNDAANALEALLAKHQVSFFQIEQIVHKMWNGVYYTTTKNQENFWRELDSNCAIIFRQRQIINKQKKLDRSF